MIDIIKQTPIEYSKQSRDYQVIARLYSALFNVSKMYIDNMNVWEPDIDNKLALLRAKSLNFQPNHAWDLDDLEAITSCFKYLVKNKGTIKALQYCISILMKVEKISGDVDSTTISYDTSDRYNIIIRLEDQLATLGIIEDLIKYLLPIGYSYRVIYKKSAHVNDDWVNTDVNILNGGGSITHTTKKYDESRFIGDSDKDLKVENGLYVINYSEYTCVYNDVTKKWEWIFVKNDSIAAKYESGAYYINYLDSSRKEKFEEIEDVTSKKKIKFEDITSAHLITTSFIDKHTQGEKEGNN